MNRLRIILSSNRTLHEMLIGVALSNIVILLIGLIACQDKIKAIIGVVAGCAVAVVYLVHMAVTIDDALCLDEKGAAAQMRKNMMIRYLIVCVIVGGVCYFEIANPVLCVLSCLTVKTGAYMQPIIHNKLFRSEVDEESGSGNGGTISE